MTLDEINNIESDSHRTAMLELYNKEARVKDKGLNQRVYNSLQRLNKGLRDKIYLNGQQHFNVDISASFFQIINNYFEENLQRGDKLLTKDIKNDVVYESTSNLLDKDKEEAKFLLLINNYLLNNNKLKNGYWQHWRNCSNDIRKYDKNFLFRKYQGQEVDIVYKISYILWNDYGIENVPVQDSISVWGEENVEIVKNLFNKFNIKTKLDI
jgi:hypothetical protein